MPDIITHIQFGFDIINKLEVSKWSEAIKKNKNLFILGCQGPDIFFYNDFLPWIKNKRGRKIGNSLHLEKTGDFFVNSLKYINERIHNKEELETLFIYLSGFMCHFGLDKKTHPYIFYFTGEYDENNPVTYKYKGNHKKFEQIIDTILLKHKGGEDSYKYSIYKKIDVGKSLPKAVIDFYSYIFRELYDYKIDGCIANDSYKDLKKVLKIIHDPYGIKKGLLHIVDIIKKDKINYSELTYHIRMDFSLDYMNKNHDKWVHPCDKNEEYTDSFYDLYNKALLDSCKMISSSISFLEGNITENELIKAFPNLTYCTGKINDEKYVKKYFSPIFK